MKAWIAVGVVVAVLLTGLVASTFLLGLSAAAAQHLCEAPDEEVAGVVAPQPGNGSGLAFAPLDRPGRVTLAGGRLDGAAWSTSAVLVAAAYLDTVVGGDPTRLQPSQRALIDALQASDAAAVQHLREAILGSPATAMLRVLRSIGDDVTDPPDSNEAAMSWSLRNQVRFMAALHAGRVVSKPASDLLLSAMTPTPSQQWGLGTIGASAFKGGWLTSGSVTRQMGIVNGYAVAIMSTAGPTVEQSDGDTAHVKAMSILAGVLAQHLAADTRDLDDQAVDADTVGDQLTAAQMRGLIRTHFPAKEIGNAMAIAKCESGWSSTKGAPNSDGTIDWGVFQLNDGGTLQGALRGIGVDFSTTAQARRLALDPDINTRAAAWIFTHRGWAPWVCASPQHTGIVAGLYEKAAGPNAYRYDGDGTLTDTDVPFDDHGLSDTDKADILGANGLTPAEQAQLAARCQSAGVGLTGDCPASDFPEDRLEQNALWVMRCTAVLWPQITTMYGFDLRDGTGDHPLGRAVDIMIPATPGYPNGCASSPARTDPKMIPLGDAIATYFMANAKAYGISYLIWRGRIWNADFEKPTPPSRWRIGGPQSDSDCNYSHWNHVHVSTSSQPGTGPPITALGGSGQTAGGSWMLPTKSSDWTTERHNPTGTDPGMRLHPIYHQWRCHSGWDITAPTGQPVYAPAAGRVHTSWDSGGGGNIATIDHGQGLTSLSMHLSGFAHGIDGQRVRAGQLIGYVGSTGGSTGPHLHLTTRLHGHNYDPRHWLFGEPLRRTCQ